jgi:hypothetical protein
MIRFLLSDKHKYIAEYFLAPVMHQTVNAFVFTYGRCYHRTIPNRLGRVPPLRSGVGLFASIAALKKVQRISAAITHAHCGSLKTICAIARILRAISTFASGKHLKMPEAFCGLTR